MSDKSTDDKPTFFVSRRGRRVGMHEVDLGGIDIDNQQLEATERPKSVEKPKRVKVLKKQKAPRERRGWTKKKGAILAVILFLLLLPVALAELVVAEYGNGISRAENDVSALVASTVLPAQKKTTIAADQIRSIADKVNDTLGRMCRGGFLDNAAGLYPRATTALRDCKAAQSNYSSLAGNLYELEAQARYLERVDALIKPVATPITDEYAVIGAQQAAWQTAADGVGKLSPPTSMASAHAALVTHVKSAAESWSRLNTANNEQNASGFQEAEKALASEYEAIRQTSALFEAVLSDTQAKIIASYSALK